MALEPGATAGTAAEEAPAEQLPRASPAVALPPGAAYVLDALEGEGNAQDAGAATLQQPELETPERSAKAEARRLRKEQRREDNKIRSKEKKRLLRKRKQEARREFLESLGPEKRAAFLEQERAEGKRQKEEQLSAQRHAYNAGAPKIVVNCSFSGSMNGKEHASLAKQVQMSYATARDLRAPVQMHLSSLAEDNEALPYFERLGFRNWFIHIHDKPVWEVFDAAKLVVLSPDAEEDLDQIEEDRIYVIGGLVDRSVKKGETRSQAETLGVPSVRRIPIKSCGPGGMHPVLNIDVVIHILIERLRKPTAPWVDILMECMPLRHQQALTSRARRRHAARERRSAAEAAADKPAGGKSDDDEDASSATGSGSSLSDDDQQGDGS